MWLYIYVEFFLNNKIINLIEMNICIHIYSYVDVDGFFICGKNNCGYAKLLLLAVKADYSNTRMFDSLKLYRLVFIAIDFHFCFRVCVRFFFATP